MKQSSCNELALVLAAAIASHAAALAPPQIRLAPDSASLAIAPRRLQKVAEGPPFDESELGDVSRIRADAPNDVLEL